MLIECVSEGEDDDFLATQSRFLVAMHILVGTAGVELSAWPFGFVSSQKATSLGRCVASSLAL